MYDGIPSFDREVVIPRRSVGMKVCKSEIDKEVGYLMVAGRGGVSRYLYK